MGFLSVFLSPCRGFFRSFCLSFVCAPVLSLCVSLVCSFFPSDVVSFCLWSCRAAVFSSWRRFLLSVWLFHFRALFRSFVLPLLRSRSLSFSLSFFLPIVFYLHSSVLSVFRSLVLLSFRLLVLCVVLSFFGSFFFCVFICAACGLFFLSLFCRSLFLSPPRFFD